MSKTNGRESGGPLRLSQENPHYFWLRGKPVVLIGSGEHYGAVLNADFDFGKYLAEVARHGLNHTRTFTGAYCEPPGAFKISGNTLAPSPGRLLCPWARSATPGYANGGNRFDLTQWDEAYFRRLRRFVDEAGRCGIVVELDFFCPFYEDSQWQLSPMRADNNVNGLGGVGREEVFTLDRSGGLLAVQERMVERIVRELNPCDNLYYEICNEPYFGGVGMDWQLHLAALVAKVEKGLPNRHLVSFNIANGKQKVDQPYPGVSVYNFHYATPPETVALNYHLGCPIGDNENGFKGTADRHYRMEGWQFILAGGALYSHLDYSFAVGHEDGTFRYPAEQPGGGNAAFRGQMRTLKEFIHAFDFERMRPDASFVRKPAGADVAVHALAEPGRQYALYLFGGTEKELTLTLPTGNYRAEWLDPVSGKQLGDNQFRHTGGTMPLACPAYGPDLALRLVGA